MKQISTTITTRKVKFTEFDISENWIAGFPNDNWCLIIIAEEKERTYFDEIIRKSIDRNVGYICAIGKQHDLIHNMADEVLAFREVDIEDHNLPKHHIMTVGDDDFENGLWFGLNLTYSGDTDINEIVILDLTKKAFEKIIELVSRYEKGYLPPD